MTKTQKYPVISAFELISDVLTARNIWHSEALCFSNDRTYGRLSDIPNCNEWKIICTDREWLWCCPNGLQVCISRTSVQGLHASSEGEHKPPWCVADYIGKWRKMYAAPGIRMNNATEMPLVLQVLVLPVPLNSFFVCLHIPSLDISLSPSLPSSSLFHFLHHPHFSSFPWYFCGASMRSVRYCRPLSAWSLLLCKGLNRTLRFNGWHSCIEYSVAWVRERSIPTERTPPACRRS
jgi:hypothetical protein